MSVYLLVLKTLGASKQIKGTGTAKLSKFHTAVICFNATRKTDQPIAVFRAEVRSHLC